MHFAALPPEINSGLMYTGSGPGPMLSAASAWDGLAAELHSAAAGYNSVITGLISEGWLGPASRVMAAAAAPYAAWMSATAAQAEQTAAQARAAVAAYEAAFAATVPPAVIAANRAELAVLVATNILGQNTPAIAANWAHYYEMWAQDATAMAGYETAAKPASVLTAFTQPKQTANPSGLLQQLGAAGNAAGNSAGTHAQTLASMTPSAPALAQAAPTAGPSSVLSELPTLKDAVGWGVYVPQNGSYLFSLINSLNSLMRAAGGSGAAAAGASAMAPALSGAVGSGAAGLGSLGGLGSAGSAITAGLGQSGTIGGALSVPQAWAAASPVTGSVGSTLAGAGLGVTPAASAGSPGMMGGLPMLAHALRGADAHNGAMPRFDLRPSIIPHTPAAG